MPQFFISTQNIIDNRIQVTKKSDINHILNVLRLTQGDKITVVTSEAFVYQAEITRISPDKIEADIIEKYPSHRKLNINITLAQSILKSQKQDIVIQKATELGVNTIIPFISKNTVVKIESDKDRTQKAQRWQKIAYEASKQCQRVSIPDINQIIRINELIDLTDFDVIFVCTEKGAVSSIKQFLTHKKIDKNNTPSILIIIGPEGGWDDSEICLFEKKNIPQVSLGNLILRAETAAITAISDVIYEYEL